MSRFEAVYYDGEPNERLPEWNVIEWTVQKNGTKFGKIVYQTLDLVNGEAMCKEMAEVCQAEYNLRFAEEFA